MSAAQRPAPRIALLEAGRQILAEDGLAGLSLRAVTRRVGVSPTAAYRHFADREHLLAAIAASGVWELTSALEMADRTAAQPLNAQAVAYLHFAQTNPALYRLIFGPERFGHYPELENALATSYGVLATRITKLLSPGPASASKSFACWCGLHGLASLTIDGHLNTDETTPAEQAIRLINALIKS